MYLQKTFRFGLLTVMATLAVSTLPLNAQQLYKGNFDLPFESRWNGTTLEPGRYTVTVEQGLAMKLIRIHGEGRTTVAVVRVSDAAPLAEGSQIIFAHVGGTYAVQRLEAGSLGESFDFDIPKALKAEWARRGEKTQDTVVLSTH